MRGLRIQLLCLRVSVEYYFLFFSSITIVRDPIRTGAQVWRAPPESLGFRRECRTFGGQIFGANKTTLNFRVVKINKKCLASNNNENQNGGGTQRHPGLMLLDSSRSASSLKISF